MDVSSGSSQNVNIPGIVMDQALVEAEKARLKKMFVEIDTNRDGKLDVQELTQGLRRMGYFHITAAQIEEFIRDCDADKTGDLDKTEFVNYLLRHQQELHLVFATLDENKDGKICLQEVKDAFFRLGVTLEDDEAKKLIKRINPHDNSVSISFEEWRDYLLFHPSVKLQDIIRKWRSDCRNIYLPSRGQTFPILGSLSGEDLDYWSLEVIDLGEDIGVPDDFSDEELITGMWWRHLVAGGVAGAVSRTCTAPLDRLKIVLQVHGGRKSLGMMNALQYLYREGGILGMWRGNGINIIKIAPESAIKFAAYDVFKKLIKGDADRDIHTWERFLAGSLAGGISQTAIYPLEVLKIRLALRKTGEYRGIFDCAKKLYATDGFRVFFRGYVPNIIGILPYAGIDLTVYETLKRRYLASHVTDGSTPPAYSLLAFGTFSSCCGQVAAYPLALVRTKLQAGLNLGLPVEQTRMVGLFKYILRTEGVKGLYRGIVPNFCKVAPAVSISYYVYERTREHLGIEMS